MLTLIGSPFCFSSIERIADTAAGDLAAGPGRDEGEFVGPQPSDRVNQAHLVGQRGGNMAQHLVAGRRPAARVDVGETVDIEEQHAELGFLARRAGNLELEHALEGDLVGEAGQRVGAGQSADPVGPLMEGVLEACLANGYRAHVGQRAEHVFRVRDVGRGALERGQQSSLGILAASLIGRNERQRNKSLPADVLAGESAYRGGVLRRHGPALTDHGRDQLGWVVERHVAVLGEDDGIETGLGRGDEHVRLRVEQVHDRRCRAAGADDVAAQGIELDV